MSAPKQIRFYDNGIVKELMTVISFLKRENNGEFLYTQCGQRISLEQLESINGIRFSKLVNKVILSSCKIATETSVAFFIH